MKKAHKAEDVKPEKMGGPRCIFKRFTDAGRSTTVLCHLEGQEQNLWMSRSPGELGRVNNHSRQTGFRAEPCPCHTHTHTHVEAHQSWQTRTSVVLEQADFGLIQMFSVLGVLSGNTPPPRPCTLSDLS